MTLLESLLNAELHDDALIAQRRAGRERLRSVGLPAARDEAWRYTSLRSLAAKPFALGDDAAAGLALPVALQAQVATASPRLVFVNGVLRADLSALSGLPAGMEIELGVPLSADGAGGIGADAFHAANLALAQSGASVRVAAGAVIDSPLHLIFVGMPSLQPTAFHTRLKIVLGKGARCVLMETHHVDAVAAHLCNRVLEAELGPQSKLTHARQIGASANANSLHATHYRLQGGAVVEAVELTPGQSINRHRIEVDLDGDGAQFRSGGVQALSARAHADVQISVRHRARDTGCDLVWRGIADQRARLGFTGNLIVEIGADGADAKLSSKNLLLSPHAEINTRPVLVIHADEVKAAHGATVGRLDEQALFYLRSRGIPPARARAMLTHAFAIEALQVIGDETLRTAMSAALRDVMAGFIGAQDDGR